MKYQNEIPRSVEIIKKQLADLAKVKAISDYNANIDFASRIFLDSMNSHEQDLIEELKAAELLETKSDIE
jgi:hypothetical protein